MTGEVNVNDYVTLDNKFRLERAVLAYIGTIPESPTSATPANPLSYTVTLNPQSRYQVTNVIDDQSDATIKFDTGPVKNTVVAGTEFSNEHVSMDKYTGLSSEAIGPGAFQRRRAASPGVPVLSPPNLTPFTTAARRWSAIRRKFRHYVESCLCARDHQLQ